MQKIDEADSSNDAPAASKDRIQKKRLLDDRHVIMVERMQSPMRQSKAFVAVGALHLYG